MHYVEWVFACLAGSALVVAAAKLSGRLLNDMSDFDSLHDNVSEHVKNDHAVVLGASWTGMLTAAVLSKFFHKITVVERDTVLPHTDGEPVDAHHISRVTRRGTPQSSQLQLLQDAGVVFVKALLPTFEATLIANGGQQAERGMDFNLHQRGTWRVRQPLRMDMWLATRPVLEWTLRTLVLKAYSNITVLQNKRVLGLVSDATGHITGVRISQDGGDDTCLNASFFADCTGKHSRSPAWLEETGYGRVREEKVDPAIQYAVRYIDRTPEAMAALPKFAWLLRVDPEHPDGGRFAGAMTVEDNKLCLCAVAVNQPAPKNDEQFAAFFASLDVQEYRDLVANPQFEKGEVTVYGAGPMVRRHYHHMKAFPHNYVVMADASCFTNPVFGLGMAMAAQGVASLHAVLLSRARSTPDGEPMKFTGIGKRVMRRLAWRTLFPWLITTAEDYRYPATTGPWRRHPVIRGLQWYVEHLLATSQRDAFVDSVVMGVYGLTSNPLAVAHPRVTWHLLRRRR